MRGLAILILMLCAATGCSSATNAPGTNAHGTNHVASGTGSGTPPPAAQQSHGVTKVLVFIEENHSLNQMKSAMPYLYSQAGKYGYADQYSAITHPSLPNYLSIALGSSFGITDDDGPTSHPQSPPDVFGQALQAGRTAKSYQESMGSNCATADSGAYAVKHNPWAYVIGERDRCLVHDVPSGTTDSGALHDDVIKGTLPNVGEVTPNLDNDGHDGSLATADAWLRNWLLLIMAGPDYTSGHLAIVITADEDDHHQNNTVLTTVIHPSQHGHVVTAPLTHYSLTTLLTQVAQTPCIANGCDAASMSAAFGLPIG